MASTFFSYVTYIRTTPERLWSALTDDGAFMKQYWFGTRCDSDWTPGSPWTHVSGDGQLLDAGEIAEAEPPRRLVIRWQNANKPDLSNPKSLLETGSVCLVDPYPPSNARWTSGEKNGSKPDTANQCHRHAILGSCRYRGIS